VHWRADDAPVDRPVAIFVDAPGGVADRLAADADVTTFLNDKFHAVFHVRDPDQPSGTVQFFAPSGCALTTPELPATPKDLIDRMNALIVQPEAHAGRSPRLSRICAPTKD
jgi:hypothetical protein